jgi:hypothetical protein
MYGLGLESPMTDRSILNVFLHETLMGKA